MSTWHQSVSPSDMAHYNIFRGDHPTADDLREIFPGGEANEMNFVLFSTSGVHGTYVTIEEIEASLEKYGALTDDEMEAAPDDYCGNHLTFLIVHPRIVCLKYGRVKVELSDIPFLKQLRESSKKAISKIG